MIVVFGVGGDIDKEGACSLILEFDGGNIQSESQNGGNKKTKHAKFSENLTFFYPLIRTGVCVSGGKKRSFFGKFGVLCLLVTSVLRFALLP